MVLSRFFAFSLSLTSAVLFLTSCATVPTVVPLQVNVANVNRIESSTLELRMLTRLRIQNNNDKDVAFSGASAELQLASGKTIGTGVSAGAGVVPRYGEVLVDIPITVSVAAR